MSMKIQKDISLTPYTNYKIGGAARYFCKVKNEKEIIEVLNFADKKNLPVFILGGGTNVLISDKGFSGLVIKLQVLELKSQETKVIIGAGVKLSDVVSFALENSLSGIEWASGIPGTVGGAIRGNAGAFGGEMKDIVTEVTIIKNENRKAKNDNVKLKIKKFDNEDMKFGYRRSIVKEKRNIIVLSAIFTLKKIKNEKEKTKSKELINYYLNYRKEHQPLNYPSCGSVFKNIEEREIKKNKELLKNIKKGIVSAAVLIAKAGLVGKKIGDAQISEKHANFIINLGNAKARDVLDLIKLCQKEVYKKFGVKLKSEVEMVGFKN